MSGFTATKRIDRLVQADVFTASYRLSGKLALGATGIIGLFGESDESYVEMQDIYVSRIIEPAVILSHHELALLPKTAVQIAVLQTIRDAGPDKLLHTGTGRSVTVEAFVGTPDFEIRGKIEQAGKYEPRALLTGVGMQAVFDATATSTRKSEVKYTGVIILVNRHFIDIIAK